MAVLQAAARLFAEHGVAGVSMDQVAAAAVLPEVGEARLRDGLARLARSAARDAGQDPDS